MKSNILNKHLCLELQMEPRNCPNGHSQRAAYPRAHAMPKNGGCKKLRQTRPGTQVKKTSCLRLVIKNEERTKPSRTKNNYTMRFVTASALRSLKEIRPQRVRIDPRRQLFACLLVIHLSINILKSQFSIRLFTQMWLSCVSLGPALSRRASRWQSGR